MREGAASKRSVPSLAFCLDVQAIEAEDVEVDMHVEARARAVHARHRARGVPRALGPRVIRKASGRVTFTADTLVVPSASASTMNFPVSSGMTRVLPFVAPNVYTQDLRPWLRDTSPQPGCSSPG